MNLKNNIAVIIPAAGSSSRFGGKISKQFVKRNFFNNLFLYIIVSGNKKWVFNKNIGNFVSIFEIIWSIIADSVPKEQM